MAILLLLFMGNLGTALVELPMVAVNHLKGTIALSRKSGKSGVERWKMTVMTRT